METPQQVINRFTAQLGTSYGCGGVVTATWNEPLTRGDRVRIKEGYDDSGRVGFYEAKANDEAGKVVVFIENEANILLADAIEPYPYTREERIERAIEDANALLAHNYERDYTPITPAMHSILFAILDAGV